jgi:hypothetical protein
LRDGRKITQPGGLAMRRQDPSRKFKGLKTRMMKIPKGGRWFAGSGAGGRVCPFSTGMPAKSQSFIEIS